ncbi:class A beta-lactamase, subclass A2 [Runella slithyformis]|uniref:beta-lactamase n=1 Tax=Runella slithyformis (strain ATCC 29530 / DSM 19594 / LMG 11500 / NCIMB 11436 / LSU 4) TaxID=761193 RepID=A0A7U3ZP48_RUNSL|nr:class A beta-lactamase, subclass A2 [Runella slithyformis]AEI50781.1 Beta-lactamase [Runella slithyformis DSM 19594]
MTKSIYLTAFFFSVIIGRTAAQSTDVLRQKIHQVVSTKKATVGVAIVGPDGKDTLSFHGDGHFPLQSVFKFHIGVAMLSQVDKGKFSLTQKINIDKKDLLPDLYSPLRDKYPNGGALPLAEILQYTVAESDNVGCEVLLRLLGGAQAVEKYLHQTGVKDLSIKFNEEQQQGNWEWQFQNWTTPKAANQVLSAFYYNKPALLSPKSHAFIWKVMRETKTGAKRLRGQLPEGTVVAHKTGSSGTNKAGLTAAVNDIGIVFLPTGKPFFISVLVTDSKENAETNEKIIADIAKVTWDYFVK